MKKSISILVAVAIAVFVLTGAARAATYTIPLSDLSSPHFITQMGLETGRAPTGDGWERYSFNSSSPIMTGDSFDYDNIGLCNDAGFGITSMPLAGDGLGDLSSYNYYSLRLRNPNSFPIHVNLFMNTGDTDANPGSNNFYQDSWTWLNPGAWTLLTIDFTSADNYNDAGSQGLQPIQNLNEVSNIGIQAAVPLWNGDKWIWAGYEGLFSVDAAPAVPIPAAVWLLGSGLLGLVGLRRKFQG